MFLGNLSVVKKLLIVTAIAVAVSASTATYFTAQYKDGQHAKVMLQIEKQYSTNIEIETRKIVEAQVEITQLQTRLERQHASSNKRIQEVLDHYRNLVNANFRLRDPSATTGECTNADSGTSDSGDRETSGRELSREATDFLLEFASDADRVVAQLETCQAYALETQKILNNFFQR